MANARTALKGPNRYRDPRHLDRLEDLPSRVRISRPRRLAYDGSPLAQPGEVKHVKR